MEKDMGILLTMRQGNYTNRNAVSNVIHYVTRTGKRADRADELQGCGGCGIGIYDNSEDIIQQFLCVQNCYGIKNRGGRRMFHEIFCLEDGEFRGIGCSVDILKQIAMECSKIYFNLGYQVVYGIHHEEEKKWHIHFAVNSINFLNGRKWHTNMRESFGREQRFNEILRYFIGKQYVTPLYFGGAYTYPLQFGM